MVRVIEVNGNCFSFDLLNGLVEVKSSLKNWKQNTSFEQSITVDWNNQEKVLPFNEAASISTEPYESGVAFGIKTKYHAWEIEDERVSISIETRTWVHITTGRLYFELIPLSEPAAVKSVKWPLPFEWTDRDDQSYSVFPMMQGTLIPSNWSKEVKAIGGDHFCSKSAYMPWFGQVSHESGYIQIAETPWDCGYYLHHFPGQATEFFFNWKSSLGRIGYKRIIRTEFFDTCDYNTLCKSYRQYIREKGMLITLKQKECANPKLAELQGCPVIHSCIYFYIKPEALIYKKDDAAHNYRFATFDERKQQLKALKERGLEKAYFHLDGWGIDGYDQQHPDILPPCEKAGGAKAMRELAEMCRQSHILFALHDQYRDYYLDASSYTPENAVRAVDGTIPKECTWNGGEQNYLCATMAQDYIERNYAKLENDGIRPDGVYLDVFAATIPDECAHPEHPMTRKECMEYRASCINYLRSKGIIVSSEEAVDSLIPYMELVHHAPYPDVYMEDDVRGIPVPLTNLVYHDCLVTPWTLQDTSGGKIDEETRFLQALLNGGVPYLSIDADDEEMKKAMIVAAFHKKVGTSELVRHEFIHGDITKQRTVFENGITVTVDFINKTYSIAEEPNKCHQFF